MLLAFSRYVASLQPGEARRNHNGHIVLIHNSDVYYALDPEVYAAAQQGESSGFTLHELRRGPTVRGIGQLPMEALIHRPLGNYPVMP